MLKSSGHCSSRERFRPFFSLSVEPLVTLSFIFNRTGENEKEKCSIKPEGVYTFTSVHRLSHLINIIKLDVLNEEEKQKSNEVRDSFSSSRCFRFSFEQQTERRSVASSIDSIEKQDTE